MQLKVGSEWVYDTENCRGSRVMKNEAGEVQYYKPEFTLVIDVHKAKSSRYVSERRRDAYKIRLIDYGDTPLALGVIRKSVEMQILDYEGKLDKLNLHKDAVET